MLSLQGIFKMALLLPLLSLHRFRGHNNGYAGYYSGYQPQSNQPYAQPQPNQPYAQPQSNQPYAQPQSNQPYAQPQSNQPYAQPVGAYQNTGAPYQPNSSFQNTSSYAGTQNYPSSYYNHGDYQTSGVYPSGGYINPTNSWSEGNYGSYASHQYPNYNPDTSGASYSSTAAAAVAASPVQYQQNYKQWPDYYSQTEVTCAPGTEKVSVASTTNPLSSVPATSGYQTLGQTSTPFVPTWRPNSCPSELPSVQTGAVVATGHDGYWKHGTPTFINQSISPQQPQYQLATEKNDTYQNVQDQMKTSGPQSSVQYPAVHQMHHNYQVHAQPSQPVSSVDSRRLSTLQIPTNPRIAPNLPLDLAKSSMETSMISTAEKPVYISVSVPKQTDKTSLQGGADSMIKPGMFPKSLRGYVERALARCKDDSQKAACQAIMKDVITKATANGTLLTHDWDMEPLFHLPSVDEINKDLHYAPTVSSLSKNKRSPSKRPKSRWEPVADEKPVVKSFAAVAAAAAVGSVKFSGWGGFNNNNRKFSTGKPENRGGLSSAKLSTSEPKNINKVPFRPAKRQRPGEGLDVTDNGDASSDSDKEQSLTTYYPSATTLANTPEEKKKRENRSKRFDKGDRHHGEMNHYRPKNVRAGNLYARRANALVLSKNFEDSTAVEDIDWDALTVKGTCQEIEKRYLRLTSAPDPSSVRPEEVLEKALVMVQTAQKNYLYKCDQLKSIRQDLTVQRIRNELTVKVYETHARLAIESGDLPEYNQCQSQLQTLYAEGIKGCHMEFSAYNLLCVMLHSTSSRYLVSAMSRLPVEAKEDEAVKHALAVRRAFTAGNYVLFFRLYKNAPNLNTCLMDLHVEKMRYTALKCMSRACRPTVSIPYIAQVLGFNHTLAPCEMIEEKIDGLEECMEWLKAHGACLISDNTGEMQLDAKASSTTIYMPEPEDAVAHGDPNLAVNDFFAKNVQ
ncbi:SAC3 family protein A isoform X2 [Impatiens glandulifera]|uniref:SAC3 family protein A isoform X2 n=1 Tax=Impatiens glandulifera TaxID=253017 RepID=UPI001FB10A45|nr:SAC3 family protein A isoform X2 [Impatiens glandulifera]